MTNAIELARYGPDAVRALAHAAFTGGHDRANANNNGAPAAGADTRVSPASTPAEVAYAAATGTPNTQPATGGKSTSTLQNSDLQSLLSGNVVPVLQALVAGGTKEIMAGGPQRSDFNSDQTYQDALSAWDPGQAAKDLASMTSLLLDAQAAAQKRYQLPDGTLITSEMLNNADPSVASQARSVMENRNRTLFNGYNDLMNKAGLDQWKVDLEGATFQDTQRQAQFTNDVTAAREGMNWDTLNLSRASDAINRELSGMQESRQRADLNTKTALAAAPYATGGKTEFSPADVGALGVEAGRMAGLRPNDVAIRYPGTVTVDPAGDMAAMDAKLGVGQGALPAVPMIAPRPVLTPPQMVAAPAPPQMRGYAPPVYATAPAASPYGPGTTPPYQYTPTAPPMQPWYPGVNSGPMQ